MALGEVLAGDFRGDLRLGGGDLLTGERRGGLRLRGPGLTRRATTRLGDTCRSSVNCTVTGCPSI